MTDAPKLHRRLRAPDGTKRGDPIPGTKFYRIFCAGCNEPLRTHYELVVNNDRRAYCDNCCPSVPTKGRATSLAKRQQIGAAKVALDQYSQGDPGGEY